MYISLRSLKTISMLATKCRLSLETKSVTDCHNNQSYLNGYYSIKNTILPIYFIAINRTKGFHFVLFGCLRNFRTKIYNNINYWYELELKNHLGNKLIIFK